MRKVRLIEIDYPEFGVEQVAPAISLDEYRGRLAATRNAMAARGLTHLVVYGDREHFANIQYLTGFDPRFEEALLVVRPDGAPLLIVGNECYGYLTISPLYCAGELRAERFPTFSLIDQPRDGARPLRDILADEGIGAGTSVGTAGWKYYAESEVADPAHALELPSWMADLLRAMAGRDAVTNATDLFMHPGHGLRAFASAAEIAYYEYTGARASEGVKRILFGLREGMRDTEACTLMGYTGEPLNCHVTFATGANRDRGLTGPTGETVRRGQPLGYNVAYWGSNVCRAGWIAEGPQDLPAGAQDYVDAFAAPYMAAIGEWFRLFRIGAPGDVLYRAIADALPYEKFGIQLNPGHLIAMDEWLSSPVTPGSDIPLGSGMVMQVDVIPSHPVYFSSRIEDGMALADAALRAELAAKFPACLARCQARRQFMIDVLGFEVSEDVLPLSNIPAIVPPFFLAPRKVFALG